MSSLGEIVIKGNPIDADYGIEVVLFQELFQNSLNKL